MIFSVYNHDARCFDYYEAPGTAAQYASRGTKYRPLSRGPDGALGAFSPEALAVPLPPNAQGIGRGKQPRGLMAVRSTGSLGEYAQPQLVAPNLGTLGGYDLGEDAPVVAAPPTSGGFVQAVGAACIATVVGVLVQRALNKKGRKS